MDSGFEKKAAGREFVGCAAACAASILAAARVEQDVLAFLSAIILTSVALAALLTIPSMDGGVNNGWRAAIGVAITLAQTLDLVRAVRRRNGERLDGEGAHCSPKS